jgi:hydrogenase expression/formation protein HypE
MKASTRILLGHGAGGRLTHELVERTFLPHFDNPYLATLSDAAVLGELPPGRPALTTDGFVVDPPVFPGGDLGYLSVCGTVNDLVVSGARPLWLTWALILEEGLEQSMLEIFVRGAARAAREAGVALVAGDTKVVPRGKGDLAYAVTSGLGIVPFGREQGDQRVRPGDAVLVSGPIGDHGATVLACRHGIDGGELISDCAPLTGLATGLQAAGVDVHAMHDPTRGGIATTCYETALRARVRILLDEDAIPVRPQVLATCELLGLEPLYLACEGRALIWLARSDVQLALETLRAHPQGRGAVCIGEVREPQDGRTPLVLRTSIGGERPLDMLSGMDLPRIC